MATRPQKAPETAKKESAEIVPAGGTSVAGWEPFESLRREVDRLFDDVAGGWGRFPSRWANEIPFPWLRPERGGEAGRELLLRPAIEVAETDKEYRITAELPGLDEKDIEVLVQDDMLTIKGEKREAHEEKKEGSVVSERRYGTFQRSLRLPGGVERDKVAANMKKGVLSVVLPKSKEAQAKTRKVAIKAG